MTRDHEQIKEDLAAYALDAVDSETRARVEAHLRGCAECAMLLAQYRAVGDIMPYALSPQEAPPEERERLLARVRAGSGVGVRVQELRTKTVPRQPRRRAALLRWGAAAAVLLALLFWNVALQSEVGRLNNRVVQAGSRGTDLLVSTNAAPQAHGQLALSSDGKSGALQVVGLPPLEPGQVYQFWFARPDKSRDSAGTFSVGAKGDALITVTVPGDLQQYNQIWITREPSGGSQVPTAPHFLEGPVSYRLKASSAAWKLAPTSALWYTCAKVFVFASVTGRQRLMPIQVLDPIVAAKIAAGEVIERPASVIKELMDNCIDAGATEIRVEIRGGGQQFMRISDNGGGIAAADLPLAFVRHATSKIKTAEELFALHTLGFRGEALASVSAVGRVTISSHTAHDSVGSEMTVEGGEPGPVTPRGMPRGTIVTVRDLFFNVPVRLKFLKSAAAESAHISAIVQQYVLAYPAIRFVLVSDGKQVISSPGTGDLRDAIRQVYGQEVAGVMLPVGTPPDNKFRADEDPFADWNEDSSDTSQIAEPSAQPYQPSEKDEDVPVEVWGYISPPAVSRTNRQAQHFFVNGRTIGSRMLTFALEEAYHSLLMVGRHPIAVLNIRVHPGDVDANVHPTKSEVKFRQERAVFVALQRTVRQALSDHPTLPSFGTRGTEGWQVSQSATEAAPDGTEAPAASDDGEYKPDFSGGAQAPAPRQSGIFPEYGAPALSWSAFDGQANGAAPTAPAPTDLDGPDEADRPEGAERAGVGLDPMPALPPLPPLPSGNRLPPLRVVGQVSNTYIIAEGPDGMFLIDQHAAHERILYEKLDREMRGRSVPIQAMLQPLKLDLSARQSADIEPILPLLEEVGFSVELVKGGRDNALLITAVPAMYNTRELAGDMMAMLDELLVGSPPDRWRDQLAITLACHSAIRAGKGLGGDEMRALVTQLESCTFPRLCAHGRPTVLHLSALQLEREFGRRG